MANAAPACGSLVLNAALITVLRYSTTCSLVEASIGLPSWTAILILASAMIMPTTPRRTLIAFARWPRRWDRSAMGIAYLRGFDGALARCHAS